MKLYRIYTENINIDKIKSILNNHFENYTLIDSLGVWQGTEEKSLIIEVILRELTSNKEKISLVANEIKAINNQQAVLIISQTIDVKLV